MVDVKAYLEEFKSSPRVRIAALWYTIIVISFVIVICAIVAADQNDSAAGGNRGAGFAAIWSCFMIVGLAFGGTMVLRKYRTPLAVGIFLGTVVMMSQMMLSLFAVFVGLARETDADDDDGTDTTDHVLAAFYFLQAVCFSVFAGMLFYYRQLMIEVDDQTPGTKPEAAEKSSEKPVSAGGVNADT